MPVITKTNLHSKKSATFFFRSNSKARGKVCTHSGKLISKLKSFFGNSMTVGEKASWGKTRVTVK